MKAMPKKKNIKANVGDFQIGAEEVRAVVEVLAKGRLSEWEKVKEFESRWAKFIGVKHCICTSSGTGALITGLTALKYKHQFPPGTKVITTPLTYIADSSAISVVGFEPVYVDVDPVTFGITPEAIDEYLKKNRANKPAIILGVDLMGFPLDISGIKKIARKHRLIFFEDIAQAHGSRYDGKVCGSQADLSCTSFYIAHNIQAGEMGALTTNDAKIAKLARQIKAQGRDCGCPVCRRSEGKCPSLAAYKGAGDYDPRFSHEFIGYNFKTMEFQAALGLTQLAKARRIIRRRQANVRTLNSSLKHYQEILQLPPYSNKVSYLAYPIIIKKPRTISRGQLRSQLESKGVETRPLFGCIPTQQRAYAHLRRKYHRKLPNAEKIGKNGFYIGCHQYLTGQQIQHIINVFKEILG